MGMIVGMSQCVVDVSKSDFILMIGRQLLFLSMILFVLFFGSKPITSQVFAVVGILEGTALTSSDSASAVSKQSSTSKSTVSSISKTPHTSMDYFERELYSYLIGLLISMVIVGIMALSSKRR